MTEGNASELVKLSKSQVLIKKGMGMTVPQLASNYGLSPSQMKMALVDMGVMKREASEEVPGELTERERKFMEVCQDNNVEEFLIIKVLEELGMEYKTGRRSTRGAKKYIIIDDLTTA